MGIKLIMHLYTKSGLENLKQIIFLVMQFDFQVVKLIWHISLKLEKE